MRRGEDKRGGESARRRCARRTGRTTHKAREIVHALKRRGHTRSVKRRVITATRSGDCAVPRRTPARCTTTHCTAVCLHERRAHGRCEVPVVHVRSHRGGRRSPPPIRAPRTQPRILRFPRNVSTRSERLCERNPTVRQHVKIVHGKGNRLKNFAWYACCAAVVHAVVSDRLPKEAHHLDAHELGESRNATLHVPHCGAAEDGTVLLELSLKAEHDALVQVTHGGGRSCAARNIADD